FKRPSAPPRALRFARPGVPLPPLRGGGRAPGGLRLFSTAMVTAHSHARAPARWQDFVQLLKPRVMSLVVFTGLTGLVAAAKPVNPVLAAVAVLCIAVGAGASGALNMWYDADIDAKMRRTRGRPVPAGRVQAADAAGLGVVLSLFSVMLMGMALNWLAAGLL